MSDTTFDLPELPDLEAEINAQGLEPDFAAEAIRKWRDEARPYVIGAVESDEEKWTMADELSDRADAAIARQRQRASTIWAASSFGSTDDLGGFWSAYDSAGGDPARMKSRIIAGQKVDLDPATAERYSKLGGELNNLITHPAFKSTFEERDMTGKVMTGETTLARYTTRVVGNEAEVVMAPDNAELKPLSFRVPVPTDDELKAEIERQSQKLADLKESAATAFEQADLMANPEQQRASDEFDKQADEVGRHLRRLTSSAGKSVMINERIQRRVKDPEFGQIGDSTWGAAGEDILKGLKGASFNAAGLVSRVLPRTMEHALEAAGGLPETGSAATPEDRSMKFFAEAQRQLDGVLPGSTRNQLVGGFWNELSTGARVTAGDMLPFLGAGLASKAIAGAEGKAAMQAMKAAGVVPMGATGASMGTGMAGGSYLESTRRIINAEEAGDMETANRIRSGMDAHAVLTGALGAAVSKLSPLQNFELSGKGWKSLGLDILKEGLEEPFEGFVQRAVIDPATLGDHPAIFEPMAMEFGLGLAMAFPMAAASKIIDWHQGRKVQIEAETARAKDLAKEAGADDAATLEAIEQAHEVKIAGAAEEASKEAMAVAAKLNEIDQKLIEVERDPGLDDESKRAAREPLIKAKLDIYAGPKTEERAPKAAAEQAPNMAVEGGPNAVNGSADTAPVEPTTKIFVAGERGGPTRIMPNSPLGGKDILDFVSGMQIGPPRAQAGPEGDYDWKEQRSVPPFYQQRLFNKSSESGINEVADAAWRDGLISAATPDALMGKIFEAIDARKQARANQKIEGRMMREGEAKMIDFDQEQAKLEAKPSATEVHISELNKGDVVTVGGDPMEVVSVKFDEDGVAQETTVRSERYGDITLDQGNRPTMMADAPAEKVAINTDFLSEDDFTSDQPPASLSAIDQPAQGSQSPPERASASNPGQQGEAQSSSGEDTRKKGPTASSDSPDARSIKNEKIDQWRAERGLTPMAKAGRKSWGSLWDAAEDKLAADPRAGANLVQRLVDEARPHTDEEVPIMLQHFMRQENAAAEANEAINRLDPASPEYAEAVSRKRDADAQIEMTHLAARISGTETGRALAARKMMVDRSDVPQLGAMMADRKIDLGRNLSAEERSQVEAVHKDLTEGKAEHDKAMQQIESEQLTADNSAAVDAIANEILQLSADPEKRRKIGKQAREKLRERHDAAMKILRDKGIIGGKTTNAMGLGGNLDGEAIRAMVDVATYYIVEAGGVVADAVSKFSRDFSNVAKDQVEKIFDNAQKANARLEAKLSEIAKSNDAKTKQKTPAQIIDRAKSLLSPEEDVDPAVVRALHRAHISEGAKSEGDVTGKVADSLGKIYGREFKPDEVRRIHSQYGRVAKLPSDEVSLVQRDIKRQQLLLVKIAALKKKEPLLATGTAREQNSHEVHKLQQELEAMKRATNYRKTGPDQLSGLQDRIAARLDTLIADTKDQILGNKPIKAGKEPTEYDADNMARLEELRALRRELKARRPGESSEAADKASIKAALASKKLYEDKLRIREWEEGPAPKAKPSAALSAARAERDQAIKDYHEAERSSAEWKTRELARKTAVAGEELDTLEQKLSVRDTSKRPKKEQLSNQELDLMRARKEEINKELADLRRREPMTPDEERIYLEERLKAAQETEAKLTEELNTGVRKTPFRRERPTSPGLEAARKRIADLRKQVAKARFGDGQEAFDDWAKERIKTLNDQLDNGRKPGSKREYPDTPANRARLKEIKDLEGELKSKEAPVKRLASLEKRIEAKKDEIAKLQRDGYTPKAEAPPAATTPEIDRAQAELEALMKIEDKWHEDDGARENAAYQKRLDAAEKVLKDRMARKNFAPKPKKQIKLTAKTAARLEKFREAQKKYFEMKLADKLANMSAVGRVLDVAGQSLAVVRTVYSGGEFSMAGRQGYLPGTIALRKVPDALLKMFKSFASERSVTEAELNLKARQNYDRYQRDKLFLSDVKDWTEKKVEEANSGRWARRIPFFKNFERANSTVLNILRANAYDALHNLHKSFFGVEPTPEQGRAIAMQVNIMSGRGEFGKFENARAVGSKILFSPGHTLSRFQYIGGGALWKGDMQSKAVMTYAYAKTAAVTAVLLGLVWYASDSDEPIETDPRSSDFLKIKVGPTRIDVMAGLSQAIVFASRMFSRETKRGGKIIPLAGPDVKYGGQDLGDVIGAFSRSKLNPFLGSFANAWFKKDFSGNETDWETELNKLWKPMTWVDIADTAQAQGAPKTAVMMVGAMLGAGVSTYEPRKPKKKKTDERNLIDLR